MVTPPSVKYSRLSDVRQAMINRSQSRQSFNVFALITQYKKQRGKRWLTLRDEETSELSVRLEWKADVLWNPDRKPYNRDDLEIGDAIRISELVVQNGVAGVHSVKQLLVFKSFSESGALDYRSQAVLYVQLDAKDKERCQQLIRWQECQIRCCRFSDLKPESGVQTLCGRIMSSGVNDKGNQVVYLSDGSTPGVQSHAESQQRYVLRSASAISAGQSGASDQQQTSNWIQLLVTDPVAADQALAPDDVIVVFNAKLQHESSSDVTLISANRDKKQGNAVSVSLLSTSLSLSSSRT